MFKGFMRNVEVLQSLFDTENIKPKEVIESVEFLLSNKHVLSTLDKELALLIAVYQWLLGSKYTRLLELVTLELQGIAFRMTGKEGFDFWGLIKTEA